MIAIGVYRPPKSLSGNYLNYNWKRNLTAFAPGPLYGGTGDINLDRLRPDKNEGKLLLDLEVEQELTCLIK